MGWLGVTKKKVCYQCLHLPHGGSGVALAAAVGSRDGDMMAVSSEVSSGPRYPTTSTNVLFSAAKSIELINSTFSMRPRISLTGFVRPSVGRSVGDAFVKNEENQYF